MRHNNSVYGIRFKVSFSGERATGGGGGEVCSKPLENDGLYKATQFGGNEYGVQVCGTGAGGGSDKVVCESAGGRG